MTLSETCLGFLCFCLFFLGLDPVKPREEEILVFFTDGPFFGLPWKMVCLATFGLDSENGRRMMADIFSLEKVLFGT